MTASSKNTLKKFEEWATTKFFQFKHGGRIVVELVEGGKDPPAAPACAAVIRNSDIMDWSWRGPTLMSLT